MISFSTNSSQNTSEVVGIKRKSTISVLSHDINISLDMEVLLGAVYSFLSIHTRDKVPS